MRNLNFDYAVDLAVRGVGDRATDLAVDLALEKVVERVVHMAVWQIALWHVRGSIFRATFDSAHPALDDFLHRIKVGPC